MGSKDSADSNPNSFEIRVNDKATASGEVTRRERPKRTTTTVPEPSSSSSRMTLTNNEELLILKGIVKYQSETKLSYGSDWHAFYGHMKRFVPAEFTKRLLMSKVNSLHRRFTDNLAKAEPSFATAHDDQVFKLSVVIWGDDKATDSTNLEHDGQINEFVEQPTDLTHVEEHRTINGIVEQPTDLTHVEHQTNNENIVETKVDESGKEKKKKKRKAVNGEEEKKKKKRKVDNGEEEKKESDKVGAEELCILREALEATLLFQTFGETQQKSLLENMKNVQARKGKELIEEWKALAAEGMEMHIKVMTYSTRLGNAVASA